MANNSELLRRELNVMAAMAADMDAYLKSEVLFWPLPDSAMPRLTLGGFFMRRHRLDALQSVLPPDLAQRLSMVERVFETAVTEKIVRLEQKAHQEIDARLRQWQAYLADIKQSYDAAMNSYATAVEARVMLQNLVEWLERPPYQLQPDVARRLSQIDVGLRAKWQTGAFVWEPVWQPSYPSDVYWYLYGRPKRPTPASQE